MTNYLRLSFDPLLPIWAMALLLTLVLGLGLFAMTRRMSGQAARIGVCLLVSLALARPSIISELRKPLGDIVAIVVDHSQSQRLGNRLAQTDQALEAVQTKLKSLNQVETRVISVAQNGEDGTHLFDPLSRLLADIPTERLGGVILISDGQVHDVPMDAQRLGINAPIHALLSGNKGETDRRLIVEQAPKFAILGEVVEVGVRVEDDSVPKGTPVEVSLSIDGVPGIGQRVKIGERARIAFVLNHGGPNLVELSVPPGAQPLTLNNKRALIPIKGIRDRLRVLLVSGEPHPGERTWRNLLKADPSVDLVHFTILRPPEKQDGTPINELALIAFPTRELFVEKLAQFDLIIFDRYHWRGILPTAYFDNIARYVENGGSLLVSVDPSFATGQSLYRTPLAAVLPAQPNGEIMDGAFKPQVTDLGRRHPVTADLPGSGAIGREPGWGHWYHAMGSMPLMGETVLSGPQAKPLLQLARIGQGRVALMLSDQVWLWARGYDGGGPHAELLRRISHWLMKEPELEEEALRAHTIDGAIEIERRTLADQPAPVILTAPDGADPQVQTVSLTQASPGRWTARVPVQAQGLYRLDDGKLQTLCILGPSNSLEMSDVRATDSKLKALVERSNGGIFWLVDGLPSFRPVSASAYGNGSSAHGTQWAGIKANDQAGISDVSAMPLADPRFLLLPLLALLLFAWWREGR